MLKLRNIQYDTLIGFSGGSDRPKSTELSKITSHPCGVFSTAWPDGTIHIHESKSILEAINSVEKWNKKKSN